MESPPVWLWYRVYAVFMGLFHAGVALAIAALLVATAGQGIKGEDLVVVIVAGLFFLGALPFLAAPFLPRVSWAWHYHLVLIALGLMNLGCIPMSIPLLIYWLKPETKRFFGKLD